jgi:glycosyltransferase involved in cell wall biosynthesis
MPRSLAIVQTHATQFDTGLFRRLTANGFDLTVYYTEPDPIKPIRDPELGRTSGWDFDLGSGYSWKAPASKADGAYVQSILKAGHDLVVVSGYTQPFSLRLAFSGRLHGVRIGIRSDSILKYERAGWKRLLKRLGLPLLLKLFHTGHPTGSLAREYLRSYGMNDDRLFDYPYAIDDGLIGARLPISRANRATLRKEFSIPENAPVILAAVKFVPREDPLTVLRGFAKATSARPYAHFLFVGDGELRPAIEEEIRHHAIPNVHLAGYVPYNRLIDCFAASDIFVHPARFEQWGVSVNEAMECGVPVVTADSVGAAADLIVPGESGDTYPVGDARALGNVLIRLIDEPERRKSYAERASISVRHWGYDRTIHELDRALGQ